MGDGAAGFFEARGGCVGGDRGGGADIAGAGAGIFGIVAALDTACGEAADARGNGATDDVCVEFVEEGRDVGGPGAEVTGERGDFDTEAAALFGERDGPEVDAKEFAEEGGEGIDVVLTGRGTVAVEVGTGEGGEIGRVREIEDVGGGGLIGGVEEGGGFAGGAATDTAGSAAL